MIAVRVFHNASIMNAVGACGLQLYRYGEAVSIVFFEPNWRPDSFFGECALAQFANTMQGSRGRRCSFGSTRKSRPPPLADKIARNRALGLHTLCLLDIKVKEPNLDYLVKTGRTKYDPPRYMSIR